MLPLKYQLTFLDFNRNKAELHNVKTPFLQVKVKSSPQSNPRFVIVVPKKLDNRSVKRHMTKRIIIEGIRQNLINLSTVNDVLLKPTKIITKNQSQQLKNEIKNIFINLNN